MVDLAFFSVRRKERAIFEGMLKLLDTVKDAVGAFLGRTKLAVPVSISQCILGGCSGAAYTRNVTAVNTKLVRATVSPGLPPPFFDVALGYGPAVV